MNDFRALFPRKIKPRYSQNTWNKIETKQTKVENPILDTQENYGPKFLQVPITPVKSLASIASLESHMNHRLRLMLDYIGTRIHEL